MPHAAAKHINAEMDATYVRRHMCIKLREQGFNVVRYRVCQITKTLLLVAKRPGRHRYPHDGKPAVVPANILTVKKRRAKGPAVFRSDQGALYTSA
ncbi:hypothetical protein Pcaca05_36020 [Pectobacterium carotovorum subsp. carotovorum]|nr:hypothetical protein Pcaca05_36020 [Pectobacterium carotovorum subsp. carotovorum]